MASLVLSIALISFLYRRDELIVPSWPAESISTGMALFCAVDVLRMWPMKQLLVTFAPKVPIQITPLAVVTLIPAKAPKAVLLPPVARDSAIAPIAELPPPMVLL